MENFLTEEPKSEIGKALKKKFEDTQNELNALKTGQDGLATKKAVEDLTEAMKQQGRDYQAFMKTEQNKTVKAYGAQFAEFYTKEETQEELKEIMRSKKGVIKFEPLSHVNSDDATNVVDHVEKAVGPVSRAQGSIVGTVPPNNDTNLMSINYRNDNPLIELCSVIPTESHSYPYTQAEPKEGAFAEVLEGATKPQIDFKWENRYVTPFKIAAYETLTDEVVRDVARVRAVAEQFLRDRHDLFKANQIYFGTGDGLTAIQGATDLARTFVAGGMANKLPINTANFMDVVNSIITDIYTTHNFTDEANYVPNVVLINPVDFFLQLVAAKDNDGLPLYPQASLFNEVTLGGVRIRPWEKIPAGKIFVADMGRYNLTNWVPYSVSMGWVNDDFIKNQFTMVGESRFHAFVKNHDLQAFVYDDIATVLAAIEADS